MYLSPIGTQNPKGLLDDRSHGLAASRATWMSAQPPDTQILRPDVSPRRLRSINARGPAEPWESVEAP